MTSPHNKHEWELSGMLDFAFICKECGLIFEDMKDPFYHYKSVIYGMHETPSCEEIRMKDALE